MEGTKFQFRKLLPTCHKAAEPHKAARRGSIPLSDGGNYGPTG